MPDSGMKGEGSETKSRALPLAACIVAATVGAMAWMGGADDAVATDDRADAPATEVIEVEPMVPRARIAHASWRADGEEPPAAAAHPDDEDASLLGSADWGAGEENLTKKEASLRKAMENIQGLGVVVSEEEDEETPAEAPRKRK